MSDITERDWKIFRRLGKIALDRHCKQTLDRVEEIVHSENLSHHARYLELYKFVQDRDKLMADAFDDARRSTAVAQLVRMVSLGLVSENEMAELSEELRERVQLWLRM